MKEKITHENVVAHSRGAPAAQPRCTATTKRGLPCRSFAQRGESCLAHDPERRLEMRDARARGGAAASKLRALDGRRARLDTPEALLKFNGRLIQDTLDGSVSIVVARTVFRGVAVHRQLVEATDLERRIARLEERLVNRESDRQTWRA